MRKREIDCENAEVLLRNHFPDITWVSVRLSGTKLYVAVQERLPAGNAEEEPALVASDLVTEVAGEVTSVLVRRGTALVQAGDEVEAGTVVVSGMIPIQDDSGETVSYDLCAADADVTIHTILPYEDHFFCKKAGARADWKGEIWNWSADRRRSAESVLAAKGTDGMYPYLSADLSWQGFLSAIYPGDGASVAV